MLSNTLVWSCTTKKVFNVPAHLLNDGLVNAFLPLAFKNLQADALDIRDYSFTFDGEAVKKAMRAFKEGTLIPLTIIRTYAAA